MAQKSTQTPTREAALTEAKVLIKMVPLGAIGDLWEVAVGSYRFTFEKAAASWRLVK
jgi:hypothetical protein